MVVCKDEHVGEFNGYTTQVIDFSGNKQMRLVKGDREYTGKAPYVIVNIDGSEKHALEKFTPTL